MAGILSFVWLCALFWSKLNDASQEGAITKTEPYTTPTSTIQTSPVTTEDDNTEIDKNPKALDDEWLYNNFHNGLRLFADNIDNRFANEYNALSLEDRIEFTKRLGLLALYYRMHVKHVRHAIKGQCTTLGWGIWSCIESFYEAITEDPVNSWLTALHNTTLSDEFMAENLDSRKMERDLAIGQVLCHFTMRFEFFRKPIPFCYYDTLNDEEIRRGIFPPHWNGELLRLKFDFHDESYHDCAFKSFCPNPCEETTEEGDLVVGCPTVGKKCEIRAEFNDNIIGQRHNDWNETCSCPTSYVYHKEVGSCVLQNFCRYSNCPENEICQNREDAARCICQLGYFRDKTGNCTSVTILDDLTWEALSISVGFGTTYFYALCCLVIVLSQCSLSSALAHFLSCLIYSTIVMAADGGSLFQCLTEIQRADQTEDYEAALKAANRMIRKYPNEVVANKCKVIALVRLGRFDDAVALIEKTPEQTMGDVGFEKAYAFYRLNNNDLALESLEQTKEKTSRVLDLKAQILYRLEKFQDAYDIYRELVRNHSDANDEERKANMLAVQAQLEALGIKQTITTDILETYEQFYNAACQEIENENYEVALQHLKKAYEVGRASLLGQDMEEKEIEEELANIRVNEAFVLQKMGKRNEALKLYQQVQDAGTSDVSVKATLLNNLPSVSDDGSLNEWRKKLKLALSLDQSKLTNRQRRTLHINQALVLLLSNQREPCRRALKELAEKFGPIRDSKLVEAALLMKTDADAALKILDGEDAEQELARVQIFVAGGKIDEGLKHLQKLPANIRSRPSITSFFAALLINSGKIDESLKILQGLTTSQDPRLVRDALEMAASIEMNRGAYKQAVTHLENLSKRYPDDLSLQSQLIQAYTQVDSAKAESLTKKIFPESGAEGVNVNELEESDWILYGEKYKQKKEQKDVQDTEIVTGKLRTRKRKRKVRLPKNYDPKVPPDPERWLPKQERSTWKAKKGKKHRDREIGRGTQGSTTAGNLEYKTESPRSPLQVPVEGPRQQKPAGAKAPAKKKKKVGNKW
ncbi:unnamed protein product, partial [Mesorhabditis belari]|uniref:Signal recognition particle subunit SRP72 n=1 Tax=Mesorhabditis belari TaxID=2138241 RepID=A0AAF3EKX9_9BILA